MYPPIYQGFDTYYMGRERKRGKAFGVQVSPYANTEYPEHLKKDACIYLEGTVTHSSRGVYKVQMENDMESICTASRMDHKRVSLLVGDNVTVEIPTASLSPGSTIRARIVWRMKKQKNQV